MENIDEYVDLVTDFCLNIGIRRQLDAFRGLYTFVVTCSVCTRIYTLEWYTFMWEVTCNDLFICTHSLSAVISLLCQPFIILFHFDTDGFNGVFPMEKLHTFSPNELVTLLCGDQYPNWTREDILNYTEPKQGYTKER